MTNKSDCICTVCGVIKPFTSKFFQSDKRNKCGLRYQCLECAQRQRHTNRKQHLYNMAKYRAKKRGIKFTISLNDFNIPEKCPVLNRKFVPYQYKNKTSDYSPSLDRIDNTKGYIPGNVMVISNRANTLKRDATLSEIERLYYFMISQDKRYKNR